MQQIKIFGQIRNLLIDNNLDKNNLQKKYYFSEDKKTLIVIGNPLNIKQLYQDVQLDLYKEYVMNIVARLLIEMKEAKINSIDYRKNQKEAIKSKLIEDINELDNIATSINCKKCKNLMVLKIDKATGNKYLFCSKNNCFNKEQFYLDQSLKSKQGYYLYFGPAILEHDFETIRSLIVHELIKTYCPESSKAFFKELAKWSPNYWKLKFNNIGDKSLIYQKIINYITTINSHLSENEIKLLANLNDGEEEDDY